MIRRALVLTLAIVALVTAPAAAQDDYAGPTVAGSETSNGDIVVSGGGCPASGAVDYSVTKDGAAYTSGSTTADTNGDYSFTVETDGNGEYRVSVTCGGETTVLNETVTRAGGTAGSGPSTGAVTSAGALPTTGSDSSVPMTQIGVVSIMVGAVAVYAARRRRSSAFS